MRLAVSVFAVVVSVAGQAVAQDWIEYVSVEDGFRVDLPGQPSVTETTWTSQFDYVLPGRIYSAERGRERYSVTVIDYTSLEQQGIERAKTCPPGNAQCRENAGIMGPGYWKHDERAAIMFATFKLLQRDATLTSLAWEWQDMVEGNFVQLTNNADESRTFAYVAMHEQKLYLFEGTVPKGYPAPGLFQQSVGWVDKDGNLLRYQGIIYSNAYHGMGVYPVPDARVGGGNGGGGNAAGGANANDPGR